MATIKLQNGNVILKDGKVSCECCGGGNCNGEFSITDQNVFEITKLEHDAYKKGGTWNINGNWIQNELVPSETPNCTATGSSAISHSQSASGCDHLIYFNTNTSTAYAGPCFGDFTVDGSFQTGLNLLLKYENGKFYANYRLESNVSSSVILESPLGYPTVNFSVDGNTLVAFGSWNPVWSGYLGYQNTSSVTISATFTPDT